MTRSVESAWPRRNELLGSVLHTPMGGILRDREAVRNVQSEQAFQH